MEFLDPEHLIEVFGTIGLFAVIFAESGLLFGFFLPGDSLLLTAGLLASNGELDLGTILIGCFLAAVSGDQVGYMFGRRVGPSLFSRPDSRFFKQKNVAKAQKYFEEKGARTIVLARFIPIVRTFAPIVAGVSHMPYRTFVAFNVVGGLIWAVGVTLLGYWVGPYVEDYILLAVAGIIFVSFLPVILEVRKARREGGHGDDPVIEAIIEEGIVDVSRTGETVPD